MEATEKTTLAPEPVKILDVQVITKTADQTRLRADLVGNSVEESAPGCPRVGCIAKIINRDAKLVKCEYCDKQFTAKSL